MGRIKKGGLGTRGTSESQLDSALGTGAIEGVTDKKRSYSKRVEATAKEKGRGGDWRQNLSNTRGGIQKHAHMN